MPQTELAEARAPVVDRPGTAHLDRTGVIRRMDRPFLTHLGFGPGADLIGLPFANLWLHDARDEIGSALSAARAGIAMRHDLALDYLLGDGAGHCTAILQAEGDEIRVTLSAI